MYLCFSMFYIFLFKSIYPIKNSGFLVAILNIYVFIGVKTLDLSLVDETDISAGRGLLRSQWLA